MNTQNYAKLEKKPIKAKYYVNSKEFRVCIPVAIKNDK